VAIFLAMMMAGSVHARTPLATPRIRDMILLGQEGASRSTVSRKVLYADGWAYVSGQPGLQTVDARNPADLRLADDWTASSAQVNGSAVAYGLLYLANWSPGEGLVLFDLADPSRPAHLRTIVTAAHTWEVEVSGRLLDISIDDGTTTGIATYDLADPRAPASLGFLSMGDRLVGNAARSGRYLYVTHKSWLRVYDSANAASPRFLREIEFPALGGEARIHRGHLFVVSRTIDDGQQGGVRVYSLDDPARPEEIEFWPSFEPRDLHFQDDLLIVPASGSGIFTLDASDPAALREVAHWYVSWPGTGHGGYPVSASGARNHVLIATTGGNNPDCEDFETCSHIGARLYSVQVSIEPPRIAPVDPDLDPAPAGEEYARGLDLLEGEPAPSWSVRRGPPGLAVDASGVVKGWTPLASDAGRPFAVEVEASNADGSGREAWAVAVLPPREDLIALHRFESGEEGWTLSGWKSGPYDPGAMTRAAEGGSPGGCLAARGSGATNNQDTCNREGGIAVRALSTEGRRRIRIGFDCLAVLDRPPGASGLGSCPVLEGSGDDKLVVSFSTAGTAGPWKTALVLSGGDLPAVWTRGAVDLAGTAGVDDNPLFAVRFQWQLNTAAEQGLIDDVEVLGDPIPPEAEFLRGDANGDGTVDISDPVAALGFLFAGGRLGCLDAADDDGSGEIDITDPIYSLGFSFLGGPPPPAPFPACGEDPRADPLGCEAPPDCR